MNPFPSEPWMSFGVQVFVVSVLICTAALVAARLARSNPIIRYGACWCAVACLFAMPALTGLARQFGWTSYAIHIRSERSANDGMGPLPVAVSAGPAVSSTPAPPDRVSTLSAARGTADHATAAPVVDKHAGPIRGRNPMGPRATAITPSGARPALIGSQIVLGLWLLGTVFCLVRLLVGWFEVRRICRGAKPMTDGSTEAFFVQAQPTSTTRVWPAVLLSTEVSTPVVVGAFRPRIILPAALAGSLPREQMRHVLAHEFAHIRQRAPLVGWSQRILEALYWPNPLVRLLNRTLAVAQEEVCDNFVLGDAAAPAYAQTLLAVAEAGSKQRATAASVGLMAPHWNLEERVKGLLDPNRRLSVTMNPRSKSVLALCLTLLTVVVAGTRVVADAQKTLGAAKAGQTERQARPMVAFTARIYGAPGSRTVARHQVYVSRFDGSRRQRVSSDDFDCDGVRWIGDHRLAWIEYQPGKHDDVGFRGDLEKPNRLVLYDLRSGRKRLLGVGRWSLFSPTTSSSPSTTWIRGEGLYTQANVVYRLTPRGLTIAKDFPRDPYGDGLGEGVQGRWEWPGMPTVELLGKSGPKVEGDLGSGGRWGSEAPVFRRDEREHTFLMGPSVERLLPSHRDPAVSWCLTGSYTGSAGSDEWVYRMDWKTDTARCVVNDLLEIDFQSDNRYYAGVTHNKTPRPLGRKRVWARDVVAGDTQTGKRRLVLGGLVHATSVSIQPE